jgi:isoaspartyl peptidase/L-asparaginase-like protein (Ntn-hydrolase superfamily)
MAEHPVFDAGTGSHLNRDGHVELDAMIMDGATLNAGAVAGVRGVRNPITLARGVLETGEHMMLVGEGARTAVEYLRAGLTPDETARRSVDYLLQRGRGNGGLIILGADGTPGLAFNTTRMAYAYVAADGALVVGTDHGDA